jgi:hypothetical protein
MVRAGGASSATLALVLRRVNHLTRFLGFASSHATKIYGDLRCPQKSQVILKTKWGDGEEENGGRVKGIFCFNAYDGRRLARRLWAKGGVVAHGAWRNRRGSARGTSACVVLRVVASRRCVWRVMDL